MRRADIILASLVWLGLVIVLAMLAATAAIGDVIERNRRPQ